MKTENELAVVNESGLVVDNTNNDGLIDYINNYGNELHDNYISGMLYVAQELQNNPVFEEQLLWKIIEKKVIERTSHNLDLSTIDIQSELQQFFKLPKFTDITRKNYNRWIGKYLSWCEGKGIDPRKITRLEAENYLYTLNLDYSSNSTRCMILSVCSFYTFLVIRYPEIFHTNPFYRLSLPKIKKVRKEDVVLDKDIAELLKVFKREGREDLICAVEIMRDHGYRVGFFKNLTVSKTGRFHTDSKGVDCEGRFTPEEVRKINKSGVLKLTVNMIKNHVSRTTRKLFEEGKISCSFSCHDLRSYRITRDTELARNSVELKIVSQQFHKSVTTTMGYVRVKPGSKYSIENIRGRKSV
jgi:integrase